MIASQVSDEPALVEEIERLIERHGIDAVVDEVKSATRRKRGRRPLADMKLALPHLLTEVDEWRQAWTSRSQVAFIAWRKLSPKTPMGKATKLSQSVSSENSASIVST